jgi:hypothetical protein
LVGASTELVSAAMALSVNGPAPMGKTNPSERTPILVIDDDDVSRPIPVSFPDGG